MKITINNIEISVSIAQLVTEINANLIGFCDYDEVRFFFNLDWQKCAKTELFLKNNFITELGSVSTQCIIREIL